MTGIGDLALSLRWARRSPGFSALVVLILALGIGATTAVFTVVDAALLHPVSYPGADRIVVVLGTHPDRGPERIALAPADFLVLRDHNRSFSELGAFVPSGSLDLIGEGEPVQLERHLVSQGALEALGVRAAIGRLFQPDDYRLGQPVVVLSHRLWRGRFGGDPRIVGRQLLLGGERREVVGVLPADFRIPGGDPDLLLPLAFKPADADDRSAAYLGGIGRLRPGVSLAQARADLGGLARGLAAEHPATHRGLGVSLVPLPESFGMQASTALWAIFGAVAFVLLMTCVNVANLHLARAIGREHELAVRAALGASRWRLVRQLLAENLVLAALGGVLGLLGAALALRFLPDPRGAYLPASLGVGVGARALGLAGVATLASAALSGLLPAWRAARLGAAGLRGRGGTAAPRHERLQRGLVAVEVTLAFVLLAGAGLLMRSFLAVLDQDRGFDAIRVMTLDVALPAAHYASPRRIQELYAELARRLAALPGVEAVGAAKEIPPEEPWYFHPTVAGVEVPAAASIGWQLVVPGYFAALRTPLLAGRPLDAGDRAGGRRVALLNQAAARELLGSRPPLGAQINFHGDLFAVVGVVEDQRGPGGDAAPVAYFAYDQATVPAAMLRALSFVVRARPGGVVSAGAIRNTLWSLDRNLPVLHLETMDQRLAAAPVLTRSRFNALQMAVFAGLALCLAAVGIYGMISYSVRQRTREIGVRLALGARRGALLGMVLRRGLAVALLGIACGLAGALALARLLASLLVGVGSADPLTFVAIALLLLAVAAAACYLPARRASRLDPTAALRCE
jgi:putative ABC transport system permease protein